MCVCDSGMGQVLFLSGQMTTSALPDGPFISFTSPAQTRERAALALWTGPVAWRGSPVQPLLPPSDSTGTQPPSIRRTPGPPEFQIQMLSSAQSYTVVVVQSLRPVRLFATPKRFTEMTACQSWTDPLH